MIKGVDVTILENGNLLLTADDEAMEEIRDARDDDQRGTRRRRALFYEILEPYYTNGEYHPFEAGDANPFVGLTEAPCIAESMDVHDDGRREIVGRYWYFDRYMFACPLETMADTGQVEFTLA